MLQLIDEVSGFLSNYDIGALVVPLVIVGMIDASTIRSPSIPGVG
jgi:hypothetical protein